MEQHEIDEFIEDAYSYALDKIAQDTIFNYVVHRLGTDIYKKLEDNPTTLELGTIEMAIGDLIRKCIIIPND